MKTSITSIHIFINSFINPFIPTTIYSFINLPLPIIHKASSLTHQDKTSICTVSTTYHRCAVWIVMMTVMMMVMMMILIVPMILLTMLILTMSCCMIISLIMECCYVECRQHYHDDSITLYEEHTYHCHCQSPYSDHCRLVSYHPYTLILL